MAAYDDTPAAFGRAIRDGSRRSPGDPVKVARLTIAAAEYEPDPLRVVLGRDSDQFVHDALLQRLQGIAGQEQTAAEADV